MSKTSLRKRFIPLGSWSPDAPEFSPGFLDQIVNVIPVFGVYRTLQRLVKLSECDEPRRVTGTYVHRISVDQGLDIMQPNYSEASPPFQPKFGFQAVPPSREFWQVLRGLQANAATKVLLIPQTDEVELFGLFEGPHRVWDTVNPLIASFQYRISGGFTGAYSFEIEIGRVDINDPGNPDAFTGLTGGLLVVSGDLDVDGNNLLVVGTIEIDNADFTDPGNEFLYGWKIRHTIPSAEGSGSEQSFNAVEVQGVAQVDAITGLVSYYKNQAGSNVPSDIVPSIEGIVGDIWDPDNDTYAESVPIYSQAATGYGLIFRPQFPQFVNLQGHRINFRWSVHSTAQPISLGIFQGLPRVGAGARLIQAWREIFPSSPDTPTDFMITDVNPGLLATITNWDDVWVLFFTHVPFTDVIVSSERFHPFSGYSESDAWSTYGITPGKIESIADESEDTGLLQPIGTTESGPALKFKVTRGTVTIPQGEVGAVITRGVDYQLRSLATAATCFVRLTNAGHSAMGVTSGTFVGAKARQQAYIVNPENILNFIAFALPNTPAPHPIQLTWEVIEYVAGTADADAIVIRQTAQKDIAHSAFFLNGDDIFTINNINKCAVLITSQCLDDVETEGGDIRNTRGGAGLFVTRLIPGVVSGWRMQGERGERAIAYMSWVVIEFTGANWRNVQKIEIEPWDADWPVVNSWTPASTAGTDVRSLASFGLNPLLNLAKTFMEVQIYCEEDNEDRARLDFGATYELTGTNEITRRNSIDNEAEDLRWTYIWIIESTAATMAVRRASKYIAASAETGNRAINSIALPSPVSNLGGVSLMGMTTSTDQDLAQSSGIGYSDFIMGSVSSVTVSEALKNHNRWHHVEAVEWPVGSGTTVPANQTPWFHVKFNTYAGPTESIQSMTMTLSYANPTGTSTIRLTLTDLGSGISWHTGLTGQDIVTTMTASFTERTISIPMLVVRSFPSLANLRVRLDILSGSGGQLNVADIWLDMNAALSSWSRLYGFAYFGPAGGDNDAPAPIDISWLRLDGPAEVSDITGDELRAYIGTVEEPSSTTQVGKIYEVTSPDFATWNDVSKEDGYDSNKRDKSWSFTNFGALVIATNYSDPVQVKGEGDDLFRDLIGQEDAETEIADYVAMGGVYPRAKFAASINSFLCLANCDPTSVPGTSQPYSFWCSRYSQPNYFHIGLIEWQSSVFQLAATPGEITGLVGGEFGLVFKENSIWRADYVGLPQIFDFVQISWEQGTVQPRSLVKVENDVYFVGIGGIFVVRNGSAVSEIAGQGSVRKFIFDSQFEDFAISTITASLESESSVRVVGGYDAQTGCVVWAYMTQKDDSDWFKCDAVLVYSPRENRFSFLRGDGDGEYSGTDRIVSAADIFDANSFEISGFLSLGNRSTSNQTYLMKTIFAVHAIPPQVSSFSGSPVYGQMYRSDTIAASSFGVPLGVNIEIHKVRPILAVERVAKAPPHTVWIEANESPAVGDGTGQVISKSSLDANADGWMDLGVPLSGEFFKFGLVFSEYVEPIVKEVHGWQVVYRTAGDH